MGGAGGLLILERSRHLDFTDVPAYLGPIGRRVLGPLTNTGGASLDDTSTEVVDVIDEFLGNGLGDLGGATPSKLAAGHRAFTTYP